MNNRAYGFTFILFCCSVCAAVVFAALGGAAGQMLGQSAVELDWIRVFWICLCAAGVFFCKNIPFTQRRPILSAVVFLLLYYFWGFTIPCTRDLAFALFSGPHGNIKAAAAFGVGAGPVFLFVGAAAGRLAQLAPLENQEKKTSLVIFAASLGAAFGFYLVPFFIYSNGISWSIRVFSAWGGVLGVGLLFCSSRTITEVSPKKNGASDKIRFPGLLSSLFSFLCGGLACLAIIMWLRMLNPLFGGFPSALWLAAAVIFGGAGAGAWLLLCKPDDMPLSTAGAFKALSLFALFMAVPYAAGDRLAVFNALLQPFGAFGDWGCRLNWGIIAAVTVFPASTALGYCLALAPSLGPHRRGVQPGALLFALLGVAIAFGACKYLCASVISSNELWMLLGMATAIVSLLAAVFHKQSRGFAPVAYSLAAICLLTFSAGPGVLWKFGGTGSGAMDPTGKSRNELRRMINEARLFFIQEWEGRRGPVGLNSRDGLSLTVNGETSDDTGCGKFTQAMLGLIPAAIHQAPETALVLGLDNGCCPGKLAAIESIRSVDVAEPDTGMKRFALFYADANDSALENPKIHIQQTGFRKAVFCREKQYDIITCSPPAPCLSSRGALYSLEFFNGVSRRLKQNGMFALQVRPSRADAKATCILYATLCSVFSEVNTWQTGPDHVIIICSNEKTRINVNELRLRITAEPLRTLLANGWSAIDAEGFIARFAGSDELARAAAEKSFSGNWVSTDDRSLFSADFPSKIPGFSAADLYIEARKAGFSRPDAFNGQFDEKLVDRNLCLMFVLNDQDASLLPGVSHELIRRVAVMRLLVKHEMEEYSRLENKMNDPVYPYEQFLYCFAQAGGDNETFYKAVDELALHWPWAVDYCEAMHFYNKGVAQRSSESLVRAFGTARNNPWINQEPVLSILNVSAKVAESDVTLAKALYGALQKPFSGYTAEGRRMTSRFYAAALSGPRMGCVALSAMEPNIPWDYDTLETRKSCYEVTKDPKFEDAARDLEAFNRWQP